MGYSVLLWDMPEYELQSGTVLPVYIRSNISHVYVAGITDTETDSKELKKIEIPLWQLTDPVKKGKLASVTKKYADWIAEEAGCEVVPLKKAGKIKLAEYDAVVFGSWCMAESISKVAWFKKQLPSLAAAGKKLFVFLVGASPAEVPEAHAGSRGGPGA